MAEIVTLGLMLIGTLLMLIGSIGVVRMPDVLMRMQATSKTATLGVACMMLGVAVHFGELGIATRALAVILFAFITTPVGAHMIARAAFLSGVPLWNTTIDELRGKYDLERHRLEGGPRSQ